ncbi:AraC family transcriptional regulator [Chitinophaga pinensis]|uniref:AraC family transcriptional regulator n=1 Tax=Chitinophaga pinensis TaxID=79329 RepID=UPI00019E368F|nr:helix-turn-helix domain-containing protein [Chitinophaga pinensis]
MHPFTNIRHLYTPIQPAIKQSAEHVTYREFLPHSQLQPFIYCYWQLKTTAPLSEQFNYRVVADGCIDIFFELNNPTDNYIMGFCKKYTAFVLENNFNYVGIRFLPTMFPQLFKVNAAELSNRFEHLSAVHPETAAFIATQLHDALQPGDISQIFDQYFLQVLSNAAIDEDPRLYNALALILDNCGVVDIEKDLNTGISSRQLRRLFGFYIGDSAKTFSKVVRFQHILKAKPSAQSLRQNKLFFDSGYYDQAHFIKEFRNFYGVTPSKAFGR